MKKLLFFLLLLLSPMFVIAKSVKRVANTPRNVEILENGAVSLGSVFPYQGLVDPHAWVENGRVYVVCGHDQSWRTTDTWRMDRWEMWSSTDLINWRHERDILPTDTYIGDKPNCWAGDICERDGKYYWVFSNAHEDTGIMVADKITGPYKDLLGEPLLPSSLTPGKEYDPDFYIENGTYYLCFGTGNYSFATLADDMKSLTTKPVSLMIMHNGKNKWTADKPTLFKHKEWYYIMWGGSYAISKNLYGPYEYQENNLIGGHNSVFELNGQHYLIYEFAESYLFYRGVGLKPIYFEEDGTMRVFQSKLPDKKNIYAFNQSKMGWDVEKGTTVEWHKDGYITGKVSEKGAQISSIPYVGMDVRWVKSFNFELKNQTSSKRVRVRISTMKYGSHFWQNLEPLDWSTAPYVDVEVEANSSKMQKISIPLSKFGNLTDKFRQIIIEPAPDADKGKWSIDNIYY